MMNYQFLANCLKYYIDEVHDGNLSAFSRENFEVVGSQGTIKKLLNVEPDETPSIRLTQFESLLMFCQKGHEMKLEKIGFAGMVEDDPIQEFHRELHQF